MLIGSKYFYIKYKIINVTYSYSVELSYKKTNQLYIVGLCCYSSCLINIIYDSISRGKLKFQSHFEIYKFTISQKLLDTNEIFAYTKSLLKCNGIVYIRLKKCFVKLLNRSSKKHRRLQLKGFLMTTVRCAVYDQRTYDQLYSDQTVRKNLNVLNDQIGNWIGIRIIGQKRIRLQITISLLKIAVVLVYLSFFSHLCLAISSHSNVRYSANTVKTKYGILRGIVVRSSPLVEAYLGIPYASPPIGSLRFMPPITPSSWKNVRNADRFSPVCPQVVPLPPNGPEALLEVPRARLVQLRRLAPLLSNQSEDCLYLNIYVPRQLSTYADNGSLAAKPNITQGPHTQNMTDRRPLATILFIQGESYEWNSGNPYDGSELAAQGNVITVTINFRLGILGFLKTGGKESAQGNFGLMDLVAGIHWLKENLPAFGGGSDQITLMGYGTGAALANILLVSPVSSDLIKRVVLISGSALSPWAIQRSPLFVKRRVAEQTGCHGDLLYDDLAPCLRTKKLSDLLAVRIDYPRFLNGFAPFVDGTVIAPNSGAMRLPQLPLGSAIENAAGIEFANFPKQELMISLTSVESYLDLSAQDLEFGFNETRRDRILRTFVRNAFHFHQNEIFTVLKNEYTDWEKAIRNPYCSRDATLSFLSDGHTASQVMKIGYMHSLLGGLGFFVHFKHKTEEEEYPSRLGSVHGEDVPFWLGLPVSPLYPQNYSAHERKLSSIMIKYLSNFAKTGNPNDSKNSLSKSDVRIERDIRHPYKNNATDNNLTIDSLVLPQRGRRVLRMLNLNLNYKPSRAYRKKRSNNSLKYMKIKRSTSKEAQGWFTRSSHSHKKHSNFDETIDDNSDETGYLGDELPFWERYDPVNQLYLGLGNKAETHSHYRGHKLSMWLNLIPQLQTHSNFKGVPMRHHQFSEEDMRFYDGIVRPYSQTSPVEIDPGIPVRKFNIKTSSRVAPITPVAPRVDVTTDCGVNTTETTISPTIFINNSNASDTTPNVLENMDVLRRLGSKEQHSYTTALVATVTVGCFLLVLNVLIFAGIYHQREKRAKDAKKKEQIEETEMFMTVTPTKATLYSNCIQSTSGKVCYGEYSCFDKKTTPTTEKDVTMDDTNDKLATDSNWVCSTNTIDLLQIKCPGESLDLAEYPDPDGIERLPASTYPVQRNEISYQDINTFVNVKSEKDLYPDIPEPPPPPKAPVQLNQGGILRVSGTGQTNPPSKKRVHIQEISV